MKRAQESVWKRSRFRGCRRRPCTKLHPGFSHHPLISSRMVAMATQLEAQAAGMLRRKERALALALWLVNLPLLIPITAAATAFLCPCLSFYFVFFPIHHQLNANQSGQSWMAGAPPCPGLSAGPADWHQCPSQGLCG